MAELGRLDIVLANAGIASFGAGRELDETTWQDMIDIKLTGVWHACKAAIPHLIDRAGRVDLITSSTAGLKACPTPAHYVSAKHGVVGLMRTLARSSPRTHPGQHVHPTGVNTDMIQNEATYRLFLPGVDRPTPRAVRRSLPGH